MANQTIEELKDFVNEHMPSNSELLVLPFRTFFFRVLNFLAEVPQGSTVNQLLYSVFGTQDTNDINLQQSLGTDFTGDNLIAYLNYLPSKLAIKNFNTLTSLQQTILSDGETLRILKYSQGNPTKLFVRDIVNNDWVPVGGLTPEDSALIFGSIDDLYSKHNLQETAISNKLSKPTTGNTSNYVILGDGTTISIDSIDTNIFKNNGTTTGDRVLTLGGVFTVNINGKSWTFSGLSDKSADASFNSMLAVNAAGQIAKSDGRVPMLKAAELFTDAQIDVWRQNMRKTDETYSLGQPRIDFFLPIFIDRTLDEPQSLTILGINLFLNNSSPNAASVTLVRIKDENGVEILPNSSGIYPNEYNIDNIEVSQVNTKIINIRVNFHNYPLGQYTAKIIHNGITNILNSNATFYVTENIIKKSINTDYTRLIINPFNETSVTDTVNAISQANAFEDSNNPSTYNRYYYQSNSPVATLSELKNGICIVFALRLGSMYDSYGGWSGNTYFNLVLNRVIDSSLLAEVRIFKNNYSLSSFPNGAILNTGNRNVWEGRFYILFKNNIIKIVNPETGYVSVMSYIPTEDLYIKGVLESARNQWGQGTSILEITPIEKYDI